MEAIDLDANFRASWQSEKGLAFDIDFEFHGIRCLIEKCSQIFHVVSGDARRSRPQAYRKICPLVERFLMASTKHMGVLKLFAGLMGA